MDIKKTFFLALALLSFFAALGYPLKTETSNGINFDYIITSQDPNYILTIDKMGYDKGLFYIDFTKEVHANKTLSPAYLSFTFGSENTGNFNLKENSVSVDKGQVSMVSMYGKEHVARISKGTLYNGYKEKGRLEVKGTLEEIVRMIDEGKINIMFGSSTTQVQIITGSGDNYKIFRVRNATTQILNFNVSNGGVCEGIVVNGNTKITPAQYVAVHRVSESGGEPFTFDETGVVCSNAMQTDVVSNISCYKLLTPSNHIWYNEFTAYGYSDIIKGRTVSGSSINFRILNGLTGDFYGSDTRIFGSNFTAGFGGTSGTTSLDRGIMWANNSDGSQLMITVWQCGLQSNDCNIYGWAPYYSGVCSTQTNQGACVEPVALFNKFVDLPNTTTDYDYQKMLAEEVYNDLIGEQMDITLYNNTFNLIDENMNVFKEHTGVGNISILLQPKNSTTEQHRLRIYRFEAAINVSSWFLSTNASGSSAFCNNLTYNSNNDAYNFSTCYNDFYGVLNASYGVNGSTLFMWVNSSQGNVNITMQPSKFIGAPGTIPPVITATAPDNETYFINNLNLSFSVYDENYNSVSVDIFVNEILRYQNASFLNNTLLNFDLEPYINESGNYHIWVQANNTYPSSTTKDIYFAVKDYEIEYINYTDFVYETTTQNYTELIRYNPYMISNITARLNWGATDYGYQDQHFINSTHILLSRLVTIGLTQTNNTATNFYFDNNISYVNGSDVINSTLTYGQNIIFAYWPTSLTTDMPYYLEGSTVYSSLVSVAKLSIADIYVNFTMDVNSTFNISEQVTTYSSLGDIRTYSKDFNSYAALNNFTETRNITANFTVSYNGTTRIMSYNTSVVSFRMILTNCSVAGYSNGVPLLFSVYDEENGTAILNSTIEFMANVWNDGVYQNYSWTFYLENNNSQRICMWPEWGSFYADAWIQYSKDGYRPRTYFVYDELDNITDTVNLYLLSENLGYLTIIYVVDENGNSVEDVVVDIQRYFVGSNSYKAVAQVKTDYEGKGVTYLRPNDVYYRFILSKNYTIVRITNPTIVVCSSGTCPPYTVTISIEEQESALYFQYIDSVGYACSVNNLTNILTCTVSDSSGLSQSSQLIVDVYGALAWTNLCNNTCTSSTCSITCDLGNTTGKLYRYELYATIDSSVVLLAQDLLDYGTGLLNWGAQGLLLAFFIIGILFFIGIWSPVVAMVFGLIGLIASSMLGLAPVSTSSLIGVALIIGIFAFKMRS